MNKKMISILEFCGFEQDEKQRWILELPDPDFEDEVIKYVAREETDYHTMGQVVLVFQLYYNDLWEEECDDGEGIDLSQFILFNFE